MRWFKRWLGKLFLWMVGWKPSGHLPEAKKFVLIAAPHTSNWDLVYMLALAYVYDVHISWLGKHTLFKRPFGPLMRWLGGFPIDRRANHNVVQQIAALIQERDELVLAVPAEGTRGRREHWKSGFYFIAKEANVPIVLGFLDYKNKRGGFGPAIVPTGDVRADMDKIRAFYNTITGLHPELTSPVRLRQEDEPEALSDPSEASDTLAPFSPPTPSPESAPSASDKAAPPK